MAVTTNQLAVDIRNRFGDVRKLDGTLITTANVATSDGQAFTYSQLLTYINAGLLELYSLLKKIALQPNMQVNSKMRILQWYITEASETVTVGGASNVFIDAHDDCMLIVSQKGYKQYVPFRELSQEEAYSINIKNFDSPSPCYIKLYHLGNITISIFVPESYIVNNVLIYWLDTPSAAAYAGNVSIKDEHAHILQDIVLKNIALDNTDTEKVNFYLQSLQSKLTALIA